MFKRIAIVFLCAATVGSFLAADEQEATLKKLQELKKKRAAAAATRVTQTRAYYASLYQVPKELDPENTVERFLLLAPGGPLVVEVSMTIDEKPFRLAREKLVDAMFEGSDKNGDGELEWRTALASPVFTMGRVYGNIQGAQLQSRLNLFDLDKNGLVSRYEARLYLSRNFQGDSFALSAVAAYGGRQLVLRANGSYGGSAAAADVGKLLDVNADGVLSKEEIDGAAARLKSRDADDNDLLYATEISGLSPQATYRSRATQPILQTALMLGPLANADGIYKSMKAAYKNEKDEIVGFSRNPELFKQLDKDNNGVLEKAEVLSLNDIEPYVSLKLDVGDSQEGKGLSVVKAPEGIERKETDTAVSFDLPGVGLSFTTSKAKPQTFDYSKMATSYFTRFDKDKNGYLEKKELMANFSRQFDNWDVDRDGKVYAKDIAAAYNRMRAPMKTQIRAMAARQGNAIFERLDVSGDRRLSLREMRTAHEGVRTFDVNKDGQVTADEIPMKLVVSFRLTGGAYGRTTVVRRAGAGGATAGAAPKNDAPDWFNRMDRNRDGDVTLKEFLGGKEEFKKLDTNKDGFIEPKEAKALGDDKAEEKK